MNWPLPVLILIAVALQGCTGTEGQPTVVNKAPHTQAVTDPATGMTARQAFVDVAYDPGGKVQLYNTATHALQQDGIQIRIDGICLSACTMYLLDGCVTPQATLGFHPPSSTVAPMTRRRFDAWSAMMAEHYPPAMAQWWMQSARFSAGPVYLSGTEAIAMGARPCPPDTGSNPDRHIIKGGAG